MTGTLGNREPPSGHRMDQDVLEDRPADHGAATVDADALHVRCQRQACPLDHEVEHMQLFRGCGVSTGDLIDQQDRSGDRPGACGESRHRLEHGAAADAADQSRTGHALQCLKRRDDDRLVDVEGAGPKLSSGAEPLQTQRTVDVRRVSRAGSVARRGDRCRDIEPRRRAGRALLRSWPHRRRHGGYLRIRSLRTF